MSQAPGGAGAPCPLAWGLQSFCHCTWWWGLSLFVSRLLLHRATHSRPPGEALMEIFSGLFVLFFFLENTPVESHKPTPLFFRPFPSACLSCITKKSWRWAQLLSGCMWWSEPNPGCFLLPLSRGCTCWLIWMRNSCNRTITLFCGCILNVSDPPLGNTSAAFLLVSTVI